MIHTAFPRSSVRSTQPLSGGLRNSNFKLQLDSPPAAIVLRIYEHDPSLCQKEADVMRLVSRSVPIPEVIHIEASGLDGSPPFVLLEFVEGMSLRELKKSSPNRDALAEAAHSIGRTLALIGRFSFEKSGWLGPGPSVTAPLLEGEDPLPRFIDLCLASAGLQQRLRVDLRDRAHELIWSWAPQLAQLQNQSCLVHGDFGKRNVLVRRITDRWSVAAVLDWEFAISGSPLADIGHFLRYERAARPLLEPHFSNGYVSAGGQLPDNWRTMARLLDLAALCESLTHDQLPDTVGTEIVELIAATIEDRDPQLP